MWAMRITRWIVLLAALGCAPQLLSGQRRAASGDGLWFSAGVGGGWLRASCAICDADRGTAGTAFLRLGGRIGRDLLVGAEAQGWRQGREAVDETLWVFSATGLWYPNRRRPLFWKVAAGVAGYRNEDDQDALSATALGVQVGAGWDFTVGSGWFLSPSVSVLVASWGGTLKFNSAELNDQLSVTLVQLTMGITRR